MENIHDAIRSLMAADSPAEALALASRAIAATPSDAALIFLRGKALWRLGRRSEAMTDYAHAAALDPTGPAPRALEHARDIADFFNPDLLNP